MAIQIEEVKKGGGASGWVMAIAAIAGVYIAYIVYKSTKEGSAGYTAAEHPIVTGDSGITPTTTTTTTETNSPNSPFTEAEASIMSTSAYRQLSPEYRVQAAKNNITYEEAWNATQTKKQGLAARAAYPGYGSANSFQKASIARIENPTAVIVAQALPVPEGTVAKGGGGGGGVARYQ